MRAIRTSLGIAFFAVAMTASAQDAAKVNPHTITVKLENEKVRVFEAVLKPGDKEALHSHPATVVYVLAGGKVRNHLAGRDPVESVVKTGDVLYREPLTHWAENIGDTTMKFLIVEMK